MCAVVEKRRQTVELAEVFRRYGDAYGQSHFLSSVQRKAIRAILLCRSAELGGHKQTCNQCGYERISYNSCRNRHCPKCQNVSQVRWLKAREAELLPVAYFHVVFTLPHELNPLALWNKKPLYDLLFHSVSQTLLAFGEKTLGGKIGATMILHTWDQRLKDHLHIHCAIPAFALQATAGKPGGNLIHARKNFLFPVKAMAAMFRGKYLAGVKQRLSDLKNVPPAMNTVIRLLYEKNWVVYAKPAFKGPKSVLDYIGRYTHRIAISNDRIIDIENHQVTFSYRDRQDGDKRKQMVLDADEFMRRFLLHVLPPSLMKIRHIGFLSNKSKKADLARCRAELEVKETVIEKKSTRDLLKDVMGLDLDECPKCHQRSLVTTEIKPLLRSDSS